MSKKIGKEDNAEEERYIEGEEYIDESDTIIFSEDGIIKVNKNLPEQVDDKREIKMFNEMLKREKRIIETYRSLMDYVKENGLPLLEGCNLGNFLNYVDD